MTDRAIRLIQEHDLDDLLALERQLFDNALSEKMLRAELKTGRGYVTEADGIHGYALLCPDDGVLDLIRLAVHPAHQGAGLGRALLERVLAEKQPVILTVRKTNLRALRLYRASGFSVVGHLHAANAWVMRWDPTPTGLTA